MAGGVANLISPSGVVDLEAVLPFSFLADFLAPRMSFMVSGSGAVLLLGLMVGMHSAYRFSDSTPSGVTCWTLVSGGSTGVASLQSSSVSLPSSLPVFSFLTVSSLLLLRSLDFPCSLPKYLWAWSPVLGACKLVFSRECVSGVVYLASVSGGSGGGGENLSSSASFMRSSLLLQPEREFGTSLTSEPLPLGTGRALRDFPLVITAVYMASEVEGLLSRLPLPSVFTTTDADFFFFPFFGISSVVSIEAHMPRSSDTFLSSALDEAGMLFTAEEVFVGVSAASSRSSSIPDISGKVGCNLVLAFGFLEALPVSHGLDVELEPSVALALVADCFKFLFASFMTTCKLSYGTMSDHPVPVEQASSLLVGRQSVCSFSDVLRDESDFSLVSEPSPVCFLLNKCGSWYWLFSQS